jgi:hypothetical protein
MGRKVLYIWSFRPINLEMMGKVRGMHAVRGWELASGR